MKLRIKVFADGADLAKMREYADREDIAGFTTNPTLLRKAGVTDYRAFAREALAIASGRPVSFEVLSDDHEVMREQAMEIASWGDSACVKVPVTNSHGESSADLIGWLSGYGVALNVTAVFTGQQVARVAKALRVPAQDERRLMPPVVSVFAGRIYDAGQDAFRVVGRCRNVLSGSCPGAQLLWASPRQVYDAVLAERAGCDIITMTPDLIAKLPTLGKDLEGFSRETCAMFARDAAESGLVL